MLSMLSAEPYDGCDHDGRMQAPLDGTASTFATVCDRPERRPRTGGKSLMRCYSIVCTTSSRGVPSAIVTTSDVMISETLRP